MNQVPREIAKNDIEKDVYKFVNKSNFHFDFEPICDKIEELRFVEKYSNLFDPTVSQFTNSHIFQQKKEEDY